MAEAKFKVGDQVVLKSGGPPMTVTLVDGVEGVWGYSLVWHLLDGNMETRGLREETLEAVTEENKAAWQGWQR